MDFCTYLISLSIVCIFYQETISMIKIDYSTEANFALSVKFRRTTSCFFCLSDPTTNLDMEKLFQPSYYAYINYDNKHWFTSACGPIFIFLRQKMNTTLKFLKPRDRLIWTWISLSGRLCRKWFAYNQQNVNCYWISSTSTVLFFASFSFHCLKS
jgi:hypothetical protein